MTLLCTRYRIFKFFVRPLEFTYLLCGLSFFVPGKILNLFIFCNSVFLAFLVETLRFFRHNSLVNFGFFYVFYRSDFSFCGFPVGAGSGLAR